MPLGAIIGGIASAAIGGFGAAASTSSSNSTAKKQAKAIDKANMQEWNYNWGEEGQVWRKYEYDQETVGIQRQNYDTQLALSEQTAMDQWSYGMTIRDFEYNERQRVRNQQIDQANTQLGFNEAAFSRGLAQQENYISEQKLALEYQELGLDVGWENNFLDYQTGQAQLDTKQRGDRAMNQLQIQATSVAGLKAEGAARASGQSGRSGAKSVQAAIAENGAKQAMYSEQNTQVGEQYALSTQQNVNGLNKAYKELFMQKQQLNATRNSLGKQDMFAREELNMQFQQANADALNKIMINPTLAPDLPVPPDLDDYKATFQDPFEPEAPEKPVKSVPNTQSVFGSFLGASAEGFGSAIGGLASMTIPKPNVNYPNGN